MNERGTCIRPVMTRGSFINEGAIQTTTVAVGTTSNGGSNGVAVGQYDKAALDMDFQAPFGLSGGPVNQVQLVGGSDAITTSAGAPPLFLVAQDARAAGSQAASGPAGTTSAFPGLSVFSASGPTGPSAIEALASANGFDTTPENVIYKMEYVQANDGGTMYLLGAPRNKIFQAAFSADLTQAAAAASRGQMTKAVASAAQFEFGEPAYSVTGNTDPYFVGAYSRLDLTASGAVVVDTVGAVQSGLDVDIYDANGDAPAETTVEDAPNQTGSLFVYNAGRPTDPVPQILADVSDLSSRGFIEDVLQDSRGYVLVGAQRAPLDDSVGGAISVRYAAPDTWPTDGSRPPIQELAQIDLNLGPNSGDIRVARFDVESDDSGNPDTLYVFGASSGSAGALPDVSTTVLSFVSEQHEYTKGSYFGLKVYPGIYNDPAIFAADDIHVFNLTTEDLATAYAQFVATLNALLASESITVQVMVDPSSKFKASFQCATAKTVVLSVVSSGPTGATLQTQQAFANLLGLVLDQQYFVVANTGPQVLTGTNPGSMHSLATAGSYNGLSWDAASPESRAYVNAMPVNGSDDSNLQGYGIDAWAFEPNTQRLAVAISDAVGANRRTAESHFFRSTIEYQHQPELATFEVPENCVDIEVHLWGAGGSSDPNSSGTGGAGAYVGGHLKGWTAGDTLQILVGSGGLETGRGVGGGGAGGRNGVGKGGGRSAILKNGRDLVCAGGGGGSTGRGLGGSATATALAAEYGMPSHNGGSGATKSTFGRGGFVYGDSKFKQAPSGTLGQGGSSAIGQKAIGGGGGGGGHYGGGAGAYLGYSADANDVATGGGGGSSFTDNLSGVVTVSGKRHLAPMTRQRYYPAAETGSTPVAAGGTRDTGGLGGHGYVVLIATLRMEGPPLGVASQDRLFESAGRSGPQALGLQIWATADGAFKTMSSADYGSFANDATALGPDWTTKFVPLTLDPSAPGSSDRLTTLYAGQDGLIVAIAESEDGSVVSGTTSYVWWTYLTAADKPGTPKALTNAGTMDAFGPIEYTDGQTQIQLGPLKNVRAIRPLEPGSLDIVFVGDGVRVVRAPGQAGSAVGWSNGRFVMGPDGNPLDSSMAFQDAQFSENDNTVQVVGRPAALEIHHLAESVWCPQFASFYEPAEVLGEELPLYGWATSSGPNGPVYMPLEPGPSGPTGPYGPGSLWPVDLNEGPYEGPLVSSDGGSKIALSPYVANMPTEGQPPVPQVPSSVFLVKRLTDPATAWTAVSFFFEPEAGQSQIARLRVALENALQGYINWLYAAVDSGIAAPTGPPDGSAAPNVAVVVGSFDILAITIERLAQADTYQLAFTTNGTGLSPSTPTWTNLFGSTSKADVDAALGSAGTLLGFGAGQIVSAATEIAGPSQYEVSWTAPASLALVASATDSPPQGQPLTPLSVAKPENSAIAGSLYHVYAPTVKLATVESGVVPEAPNGIVVAAGGPFASPLDTIKLQVLAGATGPQGSLNQPVPFPGSACYIDFVRQNLGGPYSWQLLDATGTVVQPSDAAFAEGAAIRSPANLLVSYDQASSYGHVESLLGNYLRGLSGSSETQTVASAFAVTALDAEHIGKTPGGNKAIVGPAKFQTLSDRSAILNAAVAQFNDVKWFPNPDPDATYKGFFLAVGQFVWELNAVLTTAVKWPSSPNSLPGVAWVSLDGHTWTTLPIFVGGQATLVPKGSIGGLADPMWMVYYINYIDTVGNSAILATDIGLYRFSVVDLMDTVIRLFTTDGPVVDFSDGTTLLGSQPGSTAAKATLLANAIGTSGPYAAVCSSRDATGTCIKCLGGAWPTTIPQVIGVGGSPQPDLDVCLKRPDGGANDGGPNGAYSAVEAQLDAYAIAAYAGFDAVPRGQAKSQYVSGLQQSFYQQSPDGVSSLMVCPLHVDPNSTPSAAVGSDSWVAGQLQCSLDPAFEAGAATLSTKAGSTWGALVVRRPVTAGGQPDTAYDGTAYQSDYAYQYRHLALVPYDTFGASSGSPANVPDACPSTFGLGGSAAAPPDILGAPDVYPYGGANGANSANSEGLSTALVERITNKGIPVSGPSGATVQLDGPFQENASLYSSSGGNWDPNEPPYDRAVLANGLAGPNGQESETLAAFGYQQLAGGSNGLVYNAGTSTSSSVQTANPNLYRLSSFEFPFDGQATGSDATVITIGRDPQVYEPGLGPLARYVDTNNRVGFAVSTLGNGVPGTQDGLKPWPANPLPQEGFGSWWILPAVGDGTNGTPIGAIKAGTASVAQYDRGIMQAVLGYGALALTASGPGWPTTAGPTTTNYFLYDPSTGSPAASYLSPNGGWTRFLQYSASGPTASTDIVTSSATDATGKRINQAKQAIQNMLALPLGTQTGALIRSAVAAAGSLNNWMALVSTNFFRPRNWTFSGLLLDANGVPVASSTSSTVSTAVPKLVLATDQPDTGGRYEFLVPDPWYAPVPAGQAIIGFDSGAFVEGPNGEPVQGPNYNFVTAAIAGPNASLPDGLSVIWTSTTSSSGTGSHDNIVLRHKAFHYWTLSAGGGTLDVFLNVRAILQSYLPDFSWLEAQIGSALDQAAVSSPLALAGLLSAILDESSPAAAVNAVQALQDFCADPLKNIFWSDPTAQTQRSIRSMLQDGSLLRLTAGPTTQAVYAVPVDQAGLNAIKQGLRVSSSSVMGAQAESLMRFTYSFHILVPSGAGNSAAMFAMNPNSICQPGVDASAAPSLAASAGFVPPPDARGLSAASNFVPPVNAINVVASDYAVELDNSRFFAVGGDRVRQDLLAQGPVSTATQYGDPTWGFGLRIDEPNATAADAGALLVGPTKTSAATGADLPNHHGYVSFVRTIVDGQERFVRDAKTGAISGVDATPHAHRLTYVTKYVPSQLQAYGAMVPMAPMPLAAQRQLVPNPFKPLDCCTVKDVPLVAWSRGFQAPSGLAFAAFSAKFMDLEAPGFWGRMALPLLAGSTNNFFDDSQSATGLLCDSPGGLFDSKDPDGAFVPLAGYEGLVDGSRLDIIVEAPGGSTEAVTLAAHNARRMPFTTLSGAFTYADLAVLGTSQSPAGSDDDLREFVEALPAGPDGQPGALAGQMLVDLSTVIGGLPASLASSWSADPYANAEVRFELGLVEFWDPENEMNNPPTWVRGRAGLYDSAQATGFGSTYLLNAYNAVLDANVAPTATGLLVTHAQLAEIVALALTDFINDNLALQLPSWTEQVTVSARFDAITDRPDFTIEIGDENSSALIVQFKLVLPSPVSNWCGLRPVVGPTYGLSGSNGLSDSTTNTYTVWYDRVAGSDITNTAAIGTDLVNSILYGTHNVPARPAFTVGSSQVNESFFWTNTNTWVTPGDWVHMTYMNQEAQSGGSDYAPATAWLLSGNGGFGQYVTFEVGALYITKVLVGCGDNDLSIWASNGAYINWWDIGTVPAGETTSAQTQFNIGYNGFVVAPTVWNPTKGSAGANGRPTGGWTVSWSAEQNAAAAQTAYTMDQGWCSTGWNPSVKSSGAPVVGGPAYSLFFEGSPYNPNGANNGIARSITFRGRNGFAGPDATALAIEDSVLKMCDISNVSWTTRLCANFPAAVKAGASSDCTHYWGLTVPVSGPTQTPQSLALALHADAALTRPNLVSNTEELDLLDPFQQMDLRAPFFVPSSGQGSPTQTITFDGNGGSAAIVAYPAVQVPCSLGGLGADSTGAPAGKPRPFVLSQAPAISDQAAAYAATAVSAYNAQLMALQTYNAFAPASGSATVEDPLKTNVALSQTALPGPTTAGGATWSTFGPNSAAQTWLASQQQYPVGSATGLTDASAMAVYIVTEDTFVNLGPTSRAAVDPAAGPYNRIALWAFNYSDLFATPEVQPWAGIGSSSGLQDNTPDVTAVLPNSFLSGQPYVIDAPYDSGAYSSLGRSFFIGTSRTTTSGVPCLQTSSATGQALTPRPSDPVILILCPAADTPAMAASGSQATSNTGAVALAQTYSNALVYNFTEAVYPGQQTYNVAFTSPELGPAWTFYGLDNTEALPGGVAGPLANQALSATGISAAQVYSLQDASKQHLYTGYDVRQVYPPASLAVEADPAAAAGYDPYATAPLNWASWIRQQQRFVSVAATGYRWSFVTPTYESPNWSTATAGPSVLWLPLAGTWASDGSSFALAALPQYVPNYEGLALVADWTAGDTGRSGYETGKLTNRAVDRNARKPNPNIVSTFVDPFDAGSLDLYRPRTVFVVHCDVWRNGIRTPVTLSAGSAAVFNSLPDGTALTPLPGLGGRLAVGPNASGSIEVLDCMGREDYDGSVADNVYYFGQCVAGSKMASPQAGVPTWTTTPWSLVANSGARQVWSPFTGGSYWNTFQSGAPSSAGQDPSTGFSPYLWWPTYRWLLSDQDPKNTWATSVATNPTLMDPNNAKGPQVVFACTDGSIRRLLLSAAGAPVADSTGATTFFNADINGAGNNGLTSISYTWPGRLYNLTWWANNWWCTADNNAVWTTAPLTDGTRINDQVVVNEFIGSVIQFRPLSTTEGLPDKWAKQWPSNEPHKFNVMRVITYGSNDALFVGSVDGEFLVITASGSGFSAETPTGDPEPWPFAPPAGPSVAQQALHVTDISSLGGRLVLGTMPLPLDPASEDSVPWATPGAGASVPLALALSSLSTTLNDDASSLDLVNSQHTTWLAELSSSQVVRVITTAALPTLDAAGELDLAGAMTSISTDLTNGLSGSGANQNQSGSVTLVTSGPTVTIVQGQPGSGLLRIQLPSYASLSGDAKTVFYRPSDASVGPSGGFPINPDHAKAGYGLQTSETGTSPLGSALLGIQVHKNLLLTTYDAGAPEPLLVPTINRAGHVFGQLTRAYFVIDDPTSGPQLGLKALQDASEDAIESAPDGDMEIDAELWSNTIVRTAADATPMWLNTAAYKFRLQPTDTSYAATIVSMENGPLKPLHDNGALSDDDYKALSIFSSIAVTRCSPILANITIADFAFGSGAVAAAVYGPYANEGPRIMTVQTDGSLLDTAKDDAWAAVEPQFDAGAVAAWSPYEYKWYIAGLGSNAVDAVGAPQAVNDDGSVSYTLQTPSGTTRTVQLSPASAAALRPSGIANAAWNLCQWTGAQYTPNQSRLLLVSADASRGATTQGPTDPTADVAVRFTQVFSLKSRVAGSATAGKSQQANVLEPVSRWFAPLDSTGQPTTGGSITAFGFSPNIVAVCGSVPVFVKSGPNAGKQALADGTNGPVGAPLTHAAIAWRTNLAPAGDDLRANWSFLDLGVPGTVTAIKYVGYAWYVGTWDPYGNFDAASGLTDGASSMFFASINFSAVSPLDNWSASNSTAKITSIDATVQPPGTCSDGFEPDPDNPLMCIKKCPQGYTPFGALCAQLCPAPFQETGLPNECVPDSRQARVVSPTVQGQTPPPNGPKTAPITGVEPPTGIAPIQAGAISVVVVLFIILIGLVIYKLPFLNRRRI